MNNGQQLISHIPDENSTTIHECEKPLSRPHAGTEQGTVIDRDPSLFTMKRALRQ